MKNLSTWPTRLRYSGEESYEGVALAEIVRLGERQPIYAAGASNGFDAATYGPLYYLLGEHLVNLRTPSYFPLRMLSVIGMLGCAGCCGVIAFWIARNWLSLCLAPLAFLSYGMVTDHGIQALSDAPALALSFFGFLVAYRFQNTRSILWSVPFAILSFYIKPQYVGASAAVFLFLLFERRWRLAAEFAGLVAGLGVILFSYFQWISFAGQSFWRHFLLYQVTLFSWGRLGMALLVFALLYILPLIFGIEFLRVYRIPLVSCYLAIAIVLGLLTYAKNASGVHYFFETSFVLSAVITASIVKELFSRQHPLHLMIVLIIMLLAGQ